MLLGTESLNIYVIKCTRIYELSYSNNRRERNAGNDYYLLDYTERTVFRGSCVKFPDVTQMPSSGDRKSQIRIANGVLFIFMKYNKIIFDGSRSSPRELFDFVVVYVSTVTKPRNDYVTQLSFNRTICDLISEI